MKSGNNFWNKGNIKNDISGKITETGERVVEDTRKPIYLVFILDKSGSMSATSAIANDGGGFENVKKIDQLNDGIRRVIKRLKEFEEKNTLYRIYFLIINLDSYGHAYTPQFQAARDCSENIVFEAGGCTVLDASLNTLKTFISHKYLVDNRPEREGKGYNKAVSVILMSDGCPTDSNGYALSSSEYKSIIDQFNKYLKDNDYARSVDKYSIAVGDDACEEMLRYFADGDEELGDESRFYRVEESESIASALDFVTRATLAHNTKEPVNQIDLEDDTDDDENFYKAFFNDEDDIDDEDEDDEEYEDDFDNEEDEDEEEESEHQNIEDTIYDDGENKAEKYQINPIMCNSDCTDCISSCPYGAIEQDKGIVSINSNKCIGCGECAKACPHNAIEKAGGMTDDDLAKLCDGIFD